jgi:hypothetical protein
MPRVFVGVSRSTPGTFPPVPVILPPAPSKIRWGHIDPSLVIKAPDDFDPETNTHASTIDTRPAEERLLDTVTAATIVLDPELALEDAAPSGTRAAAKALAERAEEIHKILDKTARGMRTTAVLDTSAGRIVGGGGVDLTPAQRAALQPGEIPAKAPGVHAEVTTILGARQMGAQLRAIGTTRDFCPFCIDYIQQSGGVITGPRTAVWPSSE